MRDFRGLSARSFDGQGNYSLGIKEQIIFPEIDFDKIDAIRAWTSRLPRPPKPTRRRVRARGLQLPDQELTFHGKEIDDSA